MPILGSNGDTSTTVHIGTTSDDAGIKEVQTGLNDLASTGQDAEKKLDSFTSNYAEGLKKVSLVTGAAAAGLSIYAKSSVDYLTGLVGESKNLARQTGMTVEESSKLIGAMQRLGLDAQSASTSFRNFSRQITEARENAGDASIKQQDLTNKIEGTKIQIAELTEKMKDNGDTSGELQNNIEGLKIQLKQYETGLQESTGSLDKLGIATEDAEGKSKDFYSILLEVADKFKEMPDGPEKTAAALQLFGRSGADMLKVLNQGSKGIQELAADAEALGLTLNETNINAVSEYIKSQKDLAATTDSLKIAVGTLTAPLLTDFNNKLNEVMLSLIGVDGPLREVVAGTLAFGGPILGAIAGIAGFAANIATALPLLDKLKIGITTPMVMPAIAVGAAIAALSLVIAKTQETADVIQDVGNALEDTRKSGEETDAAIKKAHEEGRISTEALNSYLKNTESVANQTKENLYTGFFGPLERAFDNLFVRAQGREAQYEGSGFGGFYTGGRVRAGVPILVGENQDGSLNSTSEIFVPDQPGRILTASDTRSMLTGNGGGNGGTSITIGTVVLSTAEAVDRFMTYDSQDQDTQNMLLSLTPSRGTA